MFIRTVNVTVFESGTFDLISDITGNECLDLQVGSSQDQIKYSLPLIPRSDVTKFSPTPKFGLILF